MINDWIHLIPDANRYVLKRFVLFGLDHVRFFFQPETTISGGHAGPHQNGRGRIEFSFRVDESGRWSMKYADTLPDQVELLCFMSPVHSADIKYLLQDMENGVNNRVNN